jgi:hypothetical protein
MIECGGTLDLSRVFPVDGRVRVYVLDSHRPYNLENVFVSTSVRGAPHLCLLLLVPLSTCTLMPAPLALQVFVVDDPAAYQGLRALAAPYTAELGRPDGSSDEEDDEEDDDDDDAVGRRQAVALGGGPMTLTQSGAHRATRRTAAVHADPLYPPNDPAAGHAM